MALPQPRRPSNISFPSLSNKSTVIWWYDRITGSIENCHFRLFGSSRVSSVERINGNVLATLRDKWFKRHSTRLLQHFSGNFPRPYFHTSIQDRVLRSLEDYKIVVERELRYKNMYISILVSIYPRYKPLYHESLSYVVSISTKNNCPANVKGRLND